MTVTSAAGAAPACPPAALVHALRYKPGWAFKVGGPDRAFLCVLATTPDSLAPDRSRCTQHMFRLPEHDVTWPEFARWAFSCLMRAEFHEAAEFLEVGGHRPFFPHHQDEGDPYEWVERWP